jgi:hypothetical protein
MIHQGIPSPGVRQSGRLGGMSVSVMLIALVQIHVGEASLQHLRIVPWCCKSMYIVVECEQRLLSLQRAVSVTTDFGHVQGSAGYSLGIYLM